MSEERKEMEEKFKTMEERAEGLFTFLPHTNKTDLIDKEKRHVDFWYVYRLVCAARMLVDINNRLEAEPTKTSASICYMFAPDRKRETTQDILEFVHFAEKDDNRIKSAVYGEIMGTFEADQLQIAKTTGVRILESIREHDPEVDSISVAVIVHDYPTGYHWRIVDAKSFIA